MSELVVLDFDGIGTAGKVQIKQAVNLTGLGAASGASTGMLIGALAGHSSKGIEHQETVDAVIEH